jgi:hypothetical protein
MKSASPEVIAERVETLRGLNLAWAASLNLENPQPDLANALYDASEAEGAALSGDLGKRVIEVGRIGVLAAHD